LCEHNTHIKKIHLDIAIRTCKWDLRISTSFLPCRLVYEGTWAHNRSRIWGSHGGEYEDGFALMMEAARTSETLVKFYQTTRRFNQKQPSSNWRTFSSVLLSEDSEKSLTLIHVFPQTRQTYWCLCLTDVWHKTLWLMEDTESHIRTNSRSLRMTGIVTTAVRLHQSFPVWDLRSFKCLVFYCSVSKKTLSQKNVKRHKVMLA
jgi:hypothetical protein